MVMYCSVAYNLNLKDVGGLKLRAINLKTNLGLCAQSSPETLADLLLVARRTYTWLEPLRYSSLDLGSTADSRVFVTYVSQKESSFLATHVLSILVASPDTNQILATCVGAVDVVLLECNNQSFVDLMAYSHLRMLSLEYIPSAAFSDFLEDNPMISFPTLTHLDFNHFAIPSTEKLTFHFPSLSHFMMDYWQAALPRFSEILDMPQIHRLVLKDDSGQAITNTDFPRHRKLIRIVLARKGLWIRGHVERNWRERRSGRTDLWELAEQIFRSRSSSSDYNEETSI
ncbi:hypothetical protein DL96DRAFT_1820151 [Flagelloscypha sp. PMI_526]|nr:hypothetical protein DL96DRAFT_1820151 [Flagelloscypha sp. PMI_526]